MKPFKDRRKWCQDVSRGLSEGSKSLPRRLKGVPRSSKIGSLELSRHLVLITMQNYNSPFTVRTSQTTQLGVQSLRKLVFDTEIVNLWVPVCHSHNILPFRSYNFLHFPTRSVYSNAEYVNVECASLRGRIYKIPFSQLTDFTMQCTVYYCAICPSFRVRSYLHDSECELLTSEFETTIDSAI